ncbi:MAG: GNAT family N-acetyltransferase [Clostridiaceae bacterium]|nr:GNAT family N-acetyltransferase [Clostridiaceae bacterium]
MNLVIREAGIKDLPDILALYKQPDMDNGEVLPVEQAETIFRKMAAYPDYKVYIAVSDNEVVGTFALAVMDNLAHMGSPSGLIEDVVVKTDRQGKGIGKQMMKYAVEYCKKCGCYKVVLSSNLKREKAHRFYESLGFIKHGYSFLTELKD